MRWSSALRELLGRQLPLALFLLELIETHGVRVDRDQSVQYVEAHVHCFAIAEMTFS
jgi:hypothetical protein